MSALVRSYPTISSGMGIIGSNIFLNSSPPVQNGGFLADDNFKCIFLNGNHEIPIRISLKFVPRSAINNKPAMVQVMAWRRTGEKPLPGPMLTQFADAYMRY